MSDAQDFALDHAAVRRSFDRASATYDAAAVLQATVRDEQLERLDVVALQPGVVLDLGCGTGHATRALKRRFRSARVVGIDLAPGMAAATRARQGWFVRFDTACGDAERLPIATESVDLAFSSLMLQWCDVETAFAEARRVLRPGGLFTFSTFGPDTLKELRAAWAAVDDQTHVNAFVDMHDLGEALLRAGFAEPVLDVEYYTVTYTEVTDLMRDLKAIGAHNVTAGRPRGLTGRGRLAALRAAYEHHRRDGRLPATYEVVFGHAWCPAGPRRAVGTTEFSVPVTSIGRRR